MRSATIFLLGAVCGTLLVGLFAPLIQPTRAKRPPPPAQAATVPFAATASRPPANTTRLKDTQNRYLETLAVTPSHRGAMSGLVAVRRQLARDDPAVLRREAAAYRNAIVKGVEIADEHYTREAMAILAEANLLAASEIEERRRRASLVALDAKPVAATRATDSTARGARETGPLSSPPRPRAVAPQGAVPRLPLKRITRPDQAPPPSFQPRPETVSPDLDERRGPRYQVQVGPVFSLEHAEAVAAILRQAGFAPRLSKNGDSARADFQIVSEILPRRAGESRGAALSDLGFSAQVRSLSKDRVQLYFGSRISRSNAEDLARRIRATGYWAAVVGGSAQAYVITLGPHGQPTVDAITSIFMTRSRLTYPVTVMPAQ